MFSFMRRSQGLSDKKHKSMLVDRAAAQATNTPRPNISPQGGGRGAFMARSCAASSTQVLGLRCCQQPRKANLAAYRFP